MVEQFLDVAGIVHRAERRQSDRLGRQGRLAEPIGALVVQGGLAHGDAPGVTELGMDAAIEDMVVVSRTYGFHQDLLGASLQDFNTVGDSEILQFLQDGFRWGHSGGHFGHGFDAGGAQENRDAFPAVIQQEKVPLEIQSAGGRSGRHRSDRRRGRETELADRPGRPHRAPKDRRYQRRGRCRRTPPRRRPCHLFPA